MNYYEYVMNKLANTISTKITISPGTSGMDHNAQRHTHTLKHWIPLPYSQNRAVDFPVLYYLVAGFNPSEKYYSDGSIIPNIWKNKKCSKPPTRLLHCTGIVLSYCIYFTLVSFSRWHRPLLSPKVLPWGSRDQGVSVAPWVECVDQISQRNMWRDGVERRGDELTGP